MEIEEINEKIFEKLVNQIKLTNKRIDLIEIRFKLLDKVLGLN